MTIRRFCQMLFITLLCLSLLPLTAGAAADKDAPTLRIYGKVWYIASLNFYGILGDNNKNYQPIRNLPREFQKDDLAVVVEGRMRDDLIAERMWGKAFEVFKITLASRYISPEDQVALQLLVARMNAFNNKSLGDLQQIDIAARGLSADDFSSWVGDFGNFTLLYVETGKNIVPDEPVIHGFCLYSRERLKGISLFGNTNYTLMSFSLNKLNNYWQFTQTAPYTPENVTDTDQFIKNLLAASLEKYKTTNLGTWKPTTP